MKAKLFCAVMSGLLLWVGLVNTCSASNDPNLVGCWTFNEGSGTVAADSAGSNNGTLMKGAYAPAMTGSWVVPGKLGNAYNFNGTTTCSVPVAAVAGIGKQVTAAFWAKGASTPHYGAAFETGGGGTFTAMMPNASGSSWGVTFLAGQGYSDQFYTVLSSSVYANNWHHYTFTKNVTTGEMRFYLDGALINSANGMTTALPSTAVYKFDIGGSIYGGSPYYGTLDDFRVYNRVISEGEINRLLHPETVCQAYNPSPVDNAGLQNPPLTLSWVPGDGADSHDVYLGTNFNDVNNAQYVAGDIDRSGVIDFKDLKLFASQWLDNPVGEEYSANLNTDSIVNFLDFALLANNWNASTGVFKGNYTTNSYSPGTLQGGQTYYWRVDEVDENGNICRGPVWRITIGLYVERTEPAASGLLLGNPGNDWGCHQTKIVRTTAGDIFTAYVVETTHGYIENEWRMAKRNANGTWTELPSVYGNAGRDPVFLMYSPVTNKLYIAAWANLTNTPWVSKSNYWHPFIWTCNASTGAIESGPTQIWTTTRTNDHPYLGAGINLNGNIVVLVSVGEGSGTLFCWAKSNPAVSSWSPHTTDYSSVKRHCYNYIFPAASSDSSGGATWVNIRDELWATLGLCVPAGGSVSGDYAFNLNAMWVHNGTSAVYTVIKEALQYGCPAGTDAYAFIFDTYEDTSGRIHVLYRFIENGVDQMRHAVRSSTGTLIADVVLPDAVPKGVGRVRIFQDSTGKYYVLCPSQIYPSDDGIVLGAPVTLDFGGYSVGPMFVAVPRCGSTRENYVDGAFLSGSGGTTFTYFRIHLR